MRLQAGLELPYDLHHRSSDLSIAWQRGAVFPGGVFDEIEDLRNAELDGRAPPVVLGLVESELVVAPLHRLQPVGDEQGKPSSGLQHCSQTQVAVQREAVVVQALDFPVSPLQS